MSTSYRLGVLGRTLGYVRFSTDDFRLRLVLFWKVILPCFCLNTPQNYFTLVWNPKIFRTLLTYDPPDCDSNTLHAVFTDYTGGSMLWYKTFVMLPHPNWMKFIIEWILSFIIKLCQLISSSPDLLYPDKPIDGLDGRLRLARLLLCFLWNQSKKNLNCPFRFKFEATNAIACLTSTPSEVTIDVKYQQVKASTWLKQNNNS